MFVIMVRGASCNYYLDRRGQREMSISDAAHFATEEDARRFCYSCLARGLFLYSWAIRLDCR